jgi:hypothetical protein
MNPTITFRRPTSFLGRNGEFTCTGVAVATLTGIRHGVMGQVVQLIPVTSAGKEGRCYIEIPQKDLQHVINLLQRIADDLVAAQGSDTTGGASSNAADPQISPL